MGVADRMKRLVIAAILGVFAPFVMITILLQRSTRRKLARFIGRFVRFVNPFMDKVADEREQWRREIAWDEVADWVFQAWPGK